MINNGDKIRDPMGYPPRGVISNNTIATNTPRLQPRGTWTRDSTLEVVISHYLCATRGGDYERRERWATIQGHGNDTWHVHLYNAVHKARQYATDVQR